MAALNAGAIPILVSEWDGPSGLGHPGNPAKNEDASVAAQIVAYNVAHAPDLPLLGGLTKIVEQDDSLSKYVQTGSGGKILSWTAPTDCDFYYIMTKWGQGQADWDHALHYVLAGESIIMYNPGGSSDPNGLSHVSIWCGEGVHTPDGGASLALLGMGLIGLGALKRKLS